MSAGGNFFSHDTALGNTTTDLYQDALAGPNSNHENRCNTAAPSTKYWDCVGDNGDGAGDQEADREHSRRRDPEPRD